MRHAKIHWLIVTVIALITTTLASPKFSSQLLNQPPDRVFVGMTTYFEDFYYYLDQFYQGKEGNLLTENRFSIERFAPTPIYFNHLMLGRLGGVFGWESFQSYNYFGIIFKFLFIVSGYFLIRSYFPQSFFRQLSAFLVFLYSTGLPNLMIREGRLIWERTADVFRASNRVMARFGTSPSGMLTNFQFILLTLAAFKLIISRSAENSHHPVRRLTVKTGAYLVMLIIFVNVTLSDAVIAGVFLFSLLLTFALTRSRNLFTAGEKDKKIFLLVMIVIYALVASTVYRSVNADPVYRAANHWDIDRYFALLNPGWPKNFLMGFGILPFFMLPGTISLIRKKNKSPELVFAAAVIITALCAFTLPLIFEIPIPGFRALFPAAYAFMSIPVIMVFERITGIFRWKHAFGACLSLYLTVNLLSFFGSWIRDIRIPDDPDHYFTFVSKELYDALVFLRTAEPRDGNVLAYPTTSIDLMIPGLAGRYAYSGHFLTTFNSAEKDDKATKFFTEWTDRPTTHDFLRKNNIRFVLATKYSYQVDNMKKYYPFLNIVFENPTATVFRYDPE